MVRAGSPRRRCYESQRREGPAKPMIDVRAEAKRCMQFACLQSNHSYMHLSAAHYRRRLTVSPVQQGQQQRRKVSTSDHHASSHCGSPDPRIASGKWHIIRQDQHPTTKTARMLVHRTLWPPVAAAVAQSIDSVSPCLRGTVQYSFPRPSRARTTRNRPSDRSVVRQDQIVATV